MLWDALSVRRSGYRSMIAVRSMLGVLRLPRCCARGLLLSPRDGGCTSLATHSVYDKDRGQVGSLLPQQHPAFSATMSATVPVKTLLITVFEVGSQTGAILTHSPSPKSSSFASRVMSSLELGSQTRPPNGS